MEQNIEVETLSGKFNRQRFEEFKAAYHKNYDQYEFFFEESTYNREYGSYLVAFLAGVFQDENSLSHKS